MEEVKKMKKVEEVKEVKKVKKVKEHVGERWLEQQMPPVSSSSSPAGINENWLVRRFAQRATAQPPNRPTSRRAHELTDLDTALAARQTARLGATLDLLHDR